MVVYMARAYSARAKFSYLLSQCILATVGAHLSSSYSNQTDSLSHARPQSPVRQSLPSHSIGITKHSSLPIYHTFLSFYLLNAVKVNFSCVRGSLCAA